MAIKAQRARARASHGHDTAVGLATRPTLGYDTAKVSATIRRWAGHDTAMRARPVRIGWAKLVHCAPGSVLTQFLT